MKMRKKKKMWGQKARMKGEKEKEKNWKISNMNIQKEKEKEKKESESLLVDENEPFKTMVGGELSHC